MIAQRRCGRINGVRRLFVSTTALLLANPQRRSPGDNPVRPRAKASRIETAVSLVHDAYVAGEGGSTGKTTQVTEMGWTTSLVSERTQSDNLNTAYTKLKQIAYTPRTYWFFLQDVPVANLFHGLLRSDGGRKRSWSAYQRLS